MDSTMFQGMMGANGSGLSPQLMQQLMMMQRQGGATPAMGLASASGAPSQTPMTSFPTPSIPGGGGGMGGGAGLAPPPPTPQSALPAQGATPSLMPGAGAAPGGASGATSAPPGASSLPGAGPGQTLLQALAGMDPAKIKAMLAQFGIGGGGATNPNYASGPIGTSQNIGMLGDYNANPGGGGSGAGLMSMLSSLFSSGAGAAG